MPKSVRAEKLRCPNPARGVYAERQTDPAGSGGGLCGRGLIMLAGSDEKSAASPNFSTTLAIRKSLTKQKNFVIVVNHRSTGDNPSTGDNKRVLPYRNRGSYESGI